MVVLHKVSCSIVWHFWMKEADRLNVFVSRRTSCYYSHQHSLGVHVFMLTCIWDSVCVCVLLQYLPPCPTLRALPPHCSASLPAGGGGVQQELAGSLHLCVASEGKANRRCTNAGSAAFLMRAQAGCLILFWSTISHLVTESPSLSLITPQCRSAALSEC